MRMFLFLALIIALVHAQEEGGGGGMEVERKIPVKRTKKPVVAPEVYENKLKERRAKQEARDNRRNNRHAKVSGMIAEYLKQGSEYIEENFESFGLSQKMNIARKWTQKKTAQAKKDVKKNAQAQQIAKFKAEFVNELGETFADDYFTGNKDKLERKMWAYAKKYQDNKLKDFKKKMKQFGKDNKAYKKQLRKIKTNNFESFKKAKEFTRLMRDQKKQMKKYDVNSTEWNVHGDEWGRLKDEKKKVMSKYNEDKKALPEPERPVLYKVKYTPRPRKSGTTFTGAEKYDKVDKKLKDKEAAKEKAREDKRKKREEEKKKNENKD